MANSCPCGCGGSVKKGNTYATKSCGVRLRHRHRPYNAHAIHQQRTGKGVNTTPSSVSWWVGISRDQFAADVAIRYPKAS